jgi:hypothetical protein
LKLNLRYHKINKILITSKKLSSINSTFPFKFFSIVFLSPLRLTIFFLAILTRETIAATI